MRLTASLWNAFARATAEALPAALILLLAVGCAPSPVVTHSTEPACAQWETYTLTPWQLGQMVGPDYPATIGPNFPNWRPLAVFIETNNRKRRDYCGAR